MHDLIELRESVYINEHNELQLLLFPYNLNLEKLFNALNTRTLKVELYSLYDYINNFVGYHVIVNSMDVWLITR